MGSEPHFTAIRLFDNPDGWVAHFTGDAIADAYRNWRNSVFSRVGICQTRPVLFIFLRLARQRVLENTVAHLFWGDHAAIQHPAADKRRWRDVERGLYTGALCGAH